MRFLKGIFIFLLVIVVLIIVAAFIFIKTFDVNKYKPQITQEIAKVLGREVTIGNIALNLSVDQKITLAVQDLTIADDPRISKENFIEVKQIDLGVDAGYFVAKRQILVSSIEFLSPSITLIRDKKGQFNASSLANKNTSPPINSDNHSQSDSPSPSVGSKEQEGEQRIPELIVRSLEIKDGRVKYIDQSFNPQMIVGTNSLSLKVNDFSIDKPFAFSFQAALWNQPENISLNGDAKIDMENMGVELSNVVFESDLSKVSLEQLRQSLVAIEALKLIKSFKGQIKAEVKRAKVNPQGFVDLDMEGQFTNGKIEVEGLASVIEASRVTFRMDESDIDIPETTLMVGSGKVIVSGKVDDYFKSQKFEFKKVVDNVELSELISQDQQIQQLYGKVSGEYHVQGIGFKYPDVLNSLSGEGNIDVKDGKLTNINILKVVLDKISMIPDLTEKLEANLPEKYKEQLKLNDTALSKVALTSAVRDGVYTVDNMEVESDVFSMTGQGELTVDYNLDLKASVFIPRDLSESMAVSAEGLKYLLDESGRIFIPITIQGKIPDLTFLPDLEYLGKKIIMNQGVQQLEKVIKKALGIEEPAESAPAEGQPGQEGQTQPSPEEKTQSPEQELIQGILDGIFK